MPIEQHNIAVFFVFDPPSILIGKTRDEPPFGQLLAKIVAARPRFVEISGVQRPLQAGESIEMQVNLDAADVTRFLAKIAHGYALHRRGMHAFRDLYLPSIILGNGDGALTFIGAASSVSANALLSSKPVEVMDRLNGDFVTVLIQLFRDSGDPPPVYEVVVGRLRD